MCLTNAVHLINFDDLTPQQKKKLAETHKKMKARRDALQKRVNELNAGLKKLEGKRGGGRSKKRR